MLMKTGFRIYLKKNETGWKLLFNILPNAHVNFQILEPIFLTFSFETHTLNKINQT